MGVVALETCSGRKATNVGKPETLLYECIESFHEISKDTCLMIGDRLDIDILFGLDCGLHTCLVMSGITTESVLAKNTTIHPKYVLESIVEFRKLNSAIDSPDRFARR